jgi:hypothetical protein
MKNEVVDPHLTTKIVTSYVRHQTVGADQVSELITSVHRIVLVRDRGFRHARPTATAPLREQLGITGPHIGCDTSPDMNGKSVKYRRRVPISSRSVRILLPPAKSPSETDALGLSVSAA